MDKRQLIIQYIEAVEERNKSLDDFRSKLSDLFGVPIELDLGVTYKSERVFDSMLEYIIGSHNYDWVMWYLYDRNLEYIKDENNFNINIDSVELLLDRCVL